ncbi:Intersectin-2 [Holothuria leucospilota]|uniref:Intersectin-2 n=1 Tax=Holothuria leucospilota TaxID=206669 RepID=A0A9Q1BXL0_HOLLE|nr:Intersectin-2 [Holothuria leucospilota]
MQNPCGIYNDLLSGFVSQSEFFSYGHLKENLQSQLQEDDCLKLTEYFALPGDQRDEIFTSDSPTENLLLALEEKGVIQPSNVDRLAEAFTQVEIKSSCSYLIDFYQKTRLQATPYGRFLATLSAHLTASLPADLCRYFHISDEKKSSITSSPDPGLSLLLALDEISTINPSEVEALKQPFSELKLVQAEAKIQEYQVVIEEEKNQLQRQRKKELFIQCLQRKIQGWYETMTPVPWKKSCRWKSTDLFVGSGLVLTDSKAKRSLTDIDEECKLQYNQILNHNRLKAEKRIILEGEPGSGKTMMSSQLAYDWSKGKICDVDVLIFLPLKFVSNVTLVEAAKRFYFSTYDSISANDIESFLTSEDLQSCLILDGFEEYNSAEVIPAGEPSEVTKVMEKSKFSNCKVILTSRSDYTKDLPTCPMLRIGRFGEKERHTYIEKVFADNTEKQQEIKRAIESNPFILDLCRVPLLFVLAVHNIESIVALQEGQLDRVAPFMENMVKQLCTLSDANNEGSVSESEGVSDESLLEKFAYNGLCKGQQVLSWQRNALEASITNLKQFLDSGILVVEEGIDKGNVRIIRDEKTQDEFSQDKKKTEKIKIEATVVDQMNQSAQVGTGAMASSFHQGYSVSEGSNENVTTISRRPVSYETEEHISSRKRFWKRFKPKIFTRKRALHSEGTTPTGEYSVTLPPASGSVQLKPETQSEPELSESQKTSNSSTAKDFPLEVKFLHKVMQEWFASKHFSSLLWNSLDDNSLHAVSYDALPQISPIDLHYILRFTSYLCPPSCYLIMDFLSQNHCTVNGVIPDYIMNCICLCFAECKQENVPQMPAWNMAVMKQGMDLVVAKLCREIIIIRSDDSRITQQSKVAMLKYAASVGILIKEVHLVDVVLEVDETSTTFTSGVTFDIFNMIEVLEMSRWDQHLEQKDYQSIVNLVLCSNSIKKARLHFPSQPPDIQKEVFGDLVIYDKTVEWIIGPKLIQMLNMETFKWEVTVQRTDVHATSLKQISATEVVAWVEEDCEAEKPDQLTITVGNIVTNMTVAGHGWWEGEVNGKRGMFPCNFVKLVILNPSKPAARTRCVNRQVDTGLNQTDKNAANRGKLWAKVITCYEPQEDDELSLEVNEQLEVTDQSQQWWWEGIAKGKKGMFPSNYVMLLPEEEKVEQHDNETPAVEAQVIYGYDAVKPDELTIKVGDIITDISAVEDGWWKGIVNEKEGMFPSNFVKVCKGPPEQSSQNKKVLAKVTSSYTPQSDSEVSLVEGDIIEITSQQDPFWWGGVVNGKQGHFPSHCVVPIPEDGEERKHQDCATPVEAQVMYDYDAVQPDELTIKVGDIITDISVVADGWCKGVVNGKEGMFPSNFVTVCTGTSEYSTQNEKVLAKVTCSHTAQSNDELSLAEGDIVEITNQQYPGCWEGILNSKRGHFPSHCVVLLPEHKEGGELKRKGYESSVEAQVMYDYNAVRPDELTIKVGDIITDTSVVKDGWWKGIVNVKERVFPSNYITLCTGPPEQSSQNKKVLAKVTSSYTPQSDSEVSLVEGDIIEITSQQDPFWWGGVVNGKQGHFPSHCVVPIPEDGEDRKQQEYATPVEAQVMFDYDAFQPDELTIKTGDIITDISVVDNGWWKGVVNGKEGMFPSNFVTVCTDTAEHFTQNEIVLAKATCSHTPQSDNELSLAENDIVEVTNRPNPGWWEGILNGKKGCFPSHCVVLLPEDKEGEELKQKVFESPGKLKH